MQQQIFQDFVQVDPETGRRSGGVGLGLAICTKLVDLMEGSLSVVSAVGRGSTFTVRLPAGPAKGEQQAEEIAPAERAMTILVVDDEPVTREVAQIMITRAGHKALAVASGEAALDLLAQRSVDLVLLDMQMPGRDGIETADAIRAMADIAQPTIVMLTADVSPESIRRLREAGLTKVLSKPATSAALLQLLGRGGGQAEGRGSVVLSPDEAIDEAFFESQAELIGDERLERLVSLFASVSRDLLGTMAAALAEANRAELERTAHQLGSSASALGLGRVLARAAALESAAATAPSEALVQAIAGIEQARDEALVAFARRGTASPRAAAE